MNTQQATERLTNLKNDLQRRASSIEADLSIALDRDSGERATQVENDEVLRGLQLEGAEQIAAIDAALLRIQGGSFGKCVKCGSEIGVERLHAVPYTPFCIDCVRSLR
ncbi:MULTISPECIES: TraR/DksA family transcriptional regulator [unclassified Rhizobium]|uniref:TraR/DksA family transcriptional regulator n=1 Tax=unclassified Rhizobium TaxID=2613769 RepID=UPI001ADA8525|nr:MULTISPECIES: TraR/DksA C4-type zinc finger protein [unclassified Rhizobium]MBO9126964.1 TraR/DksA family transcriptional regulator [Rhizobium sp. 16-488-2b]MBO9177412.1 TraR/DksA family transcriptional regulator [Rhizobium sp. 16-488-2a]